MGYGWFPNYDGLCRLLGVLADNSFWVVVVVAIWHILIAFFICQLPLLSKSPFILSPTTWFLQSVPHPNKKNIY
jgi:hypothetical protein